MDQIVFICTGNTCRSPMAEGFFRALGGEEKTGLAALSAGMYTSDGLPASGNAVTAAAELGADITSHRSRMLTPELAREAKYLVCMTGAQYDNLCAALPDCADKVFTLTPADVPTRSAAISKSTAARRLRSKPACRASSGDWQDEHNGNAGKASSCARGA